MDESNANVESHEPLDGDITNSGSAMKSGFLPRSLSQFQWNSGFGITVALILIGLLWSIPTFRGKDPHVRSGDSVVYYSQGISSAEAQQLVNSRAESIMTGTLRLDRVEGTYQVTWFVKDEPGSTDEVLELAARDGWRIMSKVFNYAPVQVRVVSATGKEIGIERCFIAGSKKHCKGDVCILHSESVTSADVERLIARLATDNQTDASLFLNNAPLYFDYRNREYILQFICYNANFEEEIPQEKLNGIQLAAQALSEECFSGARLSIQFCDAQLRSHRIVVNQSEPAKD